MAYVTTSGRAAGQKAANGRANDPNANENGGHMIVKEVPPEDDVLKESVILKVSPGQSTLVGCC